MKAARALRAICLAACMVLAPGVRADTAKCKFVKIVDWQVRTVRNLIVVDGTINGQKIGIALDTGAQRSLILRSTAVRLGLPKRAATGVRLFGVGGETRAEIATVDEFKLGEASTKDMQFLVAGEREFGEGVDVFLGEDFLHRFDVEFDLAHGAVRLYRATDCESVSLAYWTKDAVGEVAIERIDPERARINFTVAVNGRPLDAMLDSGAGTSILSKDDAATLGVTPETPGVVGGSTSQGLGGKAVAMWTGPFTSFAIGNESIPDVRIRFADLFKDAKSTATGSRVAKMSTRVQPMVLGADFLRAHRTLVAHSQQRMYFTYTGGPVFGADPLAPTPERATPP